MNPTKRSYNDWIMCPSTRFPGKYYYYNVTTGEAAWNLSDVERMISRHSFANSDKWQTYPEPESPPEETTHLWSYQPEHRMFHQPMPMFGQAKFPQYVPNMLDPMPPNMGFSHVQIPTPYRPIQTFDTTPQGWPNISQYKLYRDPTKRDFSENNYFDHNNRYFDMNKYPSFNNHRPVFNQKPMMKYPNNPGHFMHPSTMTYRDQRNMFNSQFRGPNEQFYDKIFTQNSLAAQELNRQRFMNQKFRNDSVTFGHPLSLSQENLARFNSYQTIQKQANSSRDPQGLNTGFRLFRSKSMGDINAPKHVNTFLSPKKNAFPQHLTQNFSTSKSFENLANVHSTTEPTFSPEKKVQKPSSRPQVPLKPAALENRFVFLPSDDNNDSKVTEKSQSSDQSLSETDLRYVLMARRRKSSLSERDDECNEVKKIKTAYSDDNLKPQPAKKKRVTFNLGVEDSVVDEDSQNHMDVVDTTEDAIGDAEEMDQPDQEQAPVCVIADTDVLLTEFDLIDEFVQSDETYTLVVPQSVKTEVEALGQGLSNGRHRVLSARQLVRRLADPPSHITVQPVDSPNKSEEATDIAILDCCLQYYNDGNYVILVTDNEELCKNATELEIECYSTQEIKEYMATPKAEVSFDLKKVENGGHIQVEKVKSPFAIKNDEKKITFSKNIENKQNDYVVRKTNFEEENELKIQSKTINQSNEKSFFSQNDVIMATQISRKIENLNIKEVDEKSDSRVLKEKQLNEEKEFPSTSFKNDFRIFEKTDSRKPKEKQSNEEKEIPSSSFKNDIQIEEKQNFQNGDLSNDKFCFSKNGVQAPEESGAASKKKIKDINVYNLNEHIRSFCVKNNVMEERIASRMDEWVCLFTQIMEVTLLDALRTITTPQIEDCTFPLRDVLQKVRDMYADHRTIRILIDKLCAAFDNGCKNLGKNDCPSFSMKPNEFMQMFGYGILLIKCLKKILQDSPELSEGEELLESLQVDIECGRAEPEILPTVVSAAPHTDRELCPRSDFVKKPSEVLQYLKKHYPEWNTYKTPEKSADEAQVQPKSAKITRTYGKYLGQLKLDSSKNMTLSQPNANQKNDSTFHKEQNIKTNNEFENSEIVEEELTGPKMLKKLAFHPFLPPKMKEIDVEKREKINKDIINMIESMTNKEPTKSVTKYYDLKSVIVNKNGEIDTKGQNNDNNTKNINDFQKSLEKYTKTVPCNNTDEVKRTINNSYTKEAKNTSQNNTNEENTERQKLQENSNSPKTDRKYIKTSRLDLDMLDYSDIQTTDDLSDERSLVIDTSFEATPSNNDKNDEENTNNEKHHNPIKNNTENDKLNQVDTEEENCNDNNTQNDANDNNETNAKAELNGVIDDFNDLTDGSDTESECYAYSFCQHFLCELSSTYITVYNFIKSSISQLKHKNNIRSGRKKLLHEDAAKTFTIMATIIRNLKFIIERESSDETQIIKMILKDGTRAAKDKRISRYRQVLTKCLEQARILQKALKLLQRVTGDEDIDSMSCSSISLNEYYNVFE